MLVAIIFSTPVQAGEEIGWRGYALPRLARSLGLGGASIVLGIIWACWHLPFFFIPGSDNAGQSFPVYLLAVTAISVAMAWLYWRTKGSLLLTMLMHAAINNTAGIVSSPASTTNPFALKTSLVAWLTAAVLWLSAAYFLIRMRGATLLHSQQATEERRLFDSATGEA
jgi:membrane protease YdiL (CAAX protease family)